MLVTHLVDTKFHKALTSGSEMTGSFNESKGVERGE
jgi:hypothetical protein